LDGTVDEMELNHSYSNSQIDWFHAGSALNIIHRTPKNK
jgi:hypothetical protein